MIRHDQTVVIRLNLGILQSVEFGRFIIRLQIFSKCQDRNSCHTSEQCSYVQTVPIRLYLENIWSVEKSFPMRLNSTCVVVSYLNCDIWLSVYVVKVCQCVWKLGIFPSLLVVFDIPKRLNSCQTTFDFEKFSKFKPKTSEQS